MSNRIRLTRETFDWPAFQWAQKNLHRVTETEGHRRAVLDMSVLQRVFPNGMVPLVVLLEKTRKSGIELEIVLPDEDACRRNMVNLNYAAYLCPDQDFEVGDRPSALHRFDGDESLNELINQQIHQILGQATFAEGVLQSFEWALNEIAGNVLVHSHADHGWIQVQVHPTTHHMAIAVADGGSGIPTEIRKVFPEQSLDEDAIAHALKEGITSRPDFGQGKGLTGTLQIVKINKGGKLAIHSLKGRVEWVNDRMEIKGDFPPFPGTFVDIQLNTAEPIEIEKALWGNAPAYPFNDSLYGRDTPAGIMQLPLSREARSFGNRITGVRIFW
jgi:anti-sigma regulatory factor (Ser/Thr protein kinase)